MFKITLEFPNAEWIAGLAPSQHFKLHYKIGEKTVTKMYTPISLVNQKGTVSFAIKVYRKNEQFPDGGKFTQILEDNIHIGDSIMCEGPIGKCKYFGNGKFSLMKKELPQKKKILLIAGGTGLTPCFSIAQAAIMSGDDIDISFLFSNKTKDDILCENEIDALNKVNPEKFKVFHTLTRHDDAKHGEWAGLRGRVNKEMLDKVGLPAPADDVFIFRCGPNAFCADIKTCLEENGYIENVHFN